MISKTTLKCGSVVYGFDDKKMFNLILKYGFKYDGYLISLRGLVFTQENDNGGKIKCRNKLIINFLDKFFKLS